MSEVRNLYEEHRAYKEGHREGYVQGFNDAEDGNKHKYLEWALAKEKEEEAR